MENQSPNDKRIKKFVTVILKQDTDGMKRPLEIMWEDNDGIQRFEITRLLQVCQRASLKVGGQGLRYTVEINGKQTYLWEEDNRWFVEAKQ
jgi:hypothetical protein